MNDKQTETADRRRQILDAALRVFSDKGFHKATNKDIAEAAGGISPGLIYWYFKDKQDLFFSLLREHAPIFSVIDHPERLNELPPRDALMLFARGFFASFQQPSNVALFKIVVSDAARIPEVAAALAQVAPIPIFHLLAGYFQQRIDARQMRPRDPMIAARAFVGMIMAQLLAREVFRQPEALAVDDELLLETVVDLFLQGIESRPA